LSFFSKNYWSNEVKEAKMSEIFNFDRTINAYKIVGGKPRGKRDADIDEMVILNGILGKYCRMV
jgi:hypothetical protein